MDQNKPATSAPNLWKNKRSYGFFCWSGGGGSIFHKNTTTKTPTQKHQHKTPLQQKHHNKNTTTKTAPKKHHYKDTTTKILL